MSHASEHITLPDHHEQSEPKKYSPIMSRVSKNTSSAKKSIYRLNLVKNILVMVFGQRMR